MKWYDFLVLRALLFNEANELAEKKSRGYGSEDDIFANFKLPENIGVMSAEMGAWLRLSDKVVRLGRQLVKGEEYVGFEDLVDTVLDTLNYAMVIVALRYEKDAKFREYLSKKLGVDLGIRE